MAIHSACASREEEYLPACWKDLLFVFLLALYAITILPARERLEIAWEDARSGLRRLFHEMKSIREECSEVSSKSRGTVFAMMFLREEESQEKKAPPGKPV